MSLTAGMTGKAVKAIVITATTSTSPQLLESLQKREIDLAFVMGAFSEVQGVARALIYEDDAVIVLPADLAAQKKGP